MDLAWVLFWALAAQRSAWFIWARLATEPPAAGIGERPAKSGSRAHAPLLAETLGWTLAGALGWHALMVLMGAPVEYYAAKTWWAATYLSLLTVVPVPLSLGDSSPTSWANLFLLRRRPESRAENIAVCSCIGSALGAWAGSGLMVLDWQRPWLYWPRPVVYGASLGHIGGLVVGWATAP